MPDRPLRRRRWPWIVLAVAGVFGVAGWWLSSGVIAVVSAFVNADLDGRDKVSSVASLFVGIASLLVAVVGLVIQAVRERGGPPAGSAGSSGVFGLAPSRPGMVSLAAPDGLLEEHVRGRDVLIRELSGLYGWRARRAPRVRVLHGMGGSGKTTVALSVAHQMRRRGVVVWWLSAATPTDLQTGMRQLAAGVGATEPEIDRAWAGLGSATDLLWRRLDMYSERWLLVIDNADDLRMLAPEGEPVAAKRGWIRPVTSHRGAVVVTSRDGDPAMWGDWCRLHPIGVLPTTDGAQVLLDHAGPRAGTPEEAAALAVRLGGLALALGLAGRYLAEANQLPLPGGIATFGNYRAALDTVGVTAVFGHPAGDLGDAQARSVIARTWELSLDLLDQRGLGHARPLLRLLSVLADAPIPYQLLLNPVVLATSPLFSGLDVGHLRGLLHALTGMGLLDMGISDPAGPDGDVSAPVGLRVHPLIRDASRHHLDASGQTAACLTLAVRLLAAASTGPPDDPTCWPVWRILTPHVLHLMATVSAATNPGPDLVEGAAVAALQGTRYLAAAGLYSTAETESRRILDVCQGILGADHHVTLGARADLARWTGLAGDFAAARDQCVSLVPLRERVSGAEHPDTLAARSALANWTGEAGNAAAARDQFATLVPLHERVLGAEHPDTLAARSALARWTGKAGVAWAAREQFAALLPLRERVLGAEHPDTLTARADLAYWTGRAGDFVAARDQYAALLPLRERVLGAEHPDTLAARNYLARWTGEAGDPAAARDQYAALIPQRERVSGAEHPHTLIARSSLARWTGEAGDPAAARDQYAALIPQRERVWGAEHPYTLASRATVARRTGELGDAAAARDQYAALLPLRERVLGVEHPDTLTTRASLAHWTGEAGDAVGARDQYAALLLPRERVSGPEHPDTLAVRANIAYWTARVNGE